MAGRFCVVAPKPQGNSRRLCEQRPPGALIPSFEWGHRAGGALRRKRGLLIVSRLKEKESPPSLVGRSADASQMYRIEESNRVYPEASRFVRSSNRADSGKPSSRKRRSWVNSYRINATARARPIAKFGGIFALRANRVYPSRPLPFGIGVAERVWAHLYRRRKIVCFCAEKRAETVPCWYFLSYYVKARHSKKNAGFVILLTSLLSLVLVGNLYYTTGG